MTEEPPLRTQDARSPYKTIELRRNPRSPLLSGWYYADVFLGPIPLIKLVLVLLTLILIGVWK